jgi:hypothetical protein
MNAEFTNSTEETEDTSMVENATDESAPEAPAKVRESPVTYEVKKAGKSAYTLIIDDQPVATTVTRKDADILVQLLKHLTRFSGRKYIRSGLEVVLAQPEAAEGESVTEEPQGDPMIN